MAQLEFKQGTGISLTANTSEKSVTIASTSAAFTQEEKTKLAGLESSRFKGEFASLSALNAISGSTGDYAYVDMGSGQDVTTYIWDTTDNKWIDQKGVSTAETAATIKSKYESNADTNAYTNAEKTKLAGIAASAEVNQNALSKITVGGVTVTANGKTDTFTLVAGTGVTIAADATSKTITVTADKDAILGDAITSVKVGSIILGGS
jgi:hypothetical protein